MEEERICISCLQTFKFNTGVIKEVPQICPGCGEEYSLILKEDLLSSNLEPGFVAES